MYDYEGWTLMSRLIKDHHLWTRDTIKNVSGDVTLDIAGDITLDAGADVNIPASIGLTFGDDGEKIEGDGTDLTITSSRHLVLVTGVDAGSIYLDSGTGIVNIRDESDGNDLFRITAAKDTGATTLATISEHDDGILTLAPDGDLQITPVGSVKVGVDDTGYDVKFFGASAGAYMEWDQSEDQLRIMGASADATTSTGKLLLATSLTDINANDVIGKIEFQAPHEVGGTDAITVAAGIEAVAQGTFAADLNATDIIFKTGHSEAATEKFRMTSQGEIGIGGANYGTDGQVLTSAGAGVACAWEDAGGGGGGDTNTFYMGPFGGRIGSVDNDTNFWTCGTYGVNYSFWTSENQLGDRDHGASDTNEYQMAMRVVHIPYACTLKGFSGTYYSGAASTAYLIEWWKSTPTYPTSTVSDLVFTDISINTTTPASGGYTMNQFSKTDGSVSLSAGDVLVPYISRASGSNSSYVYLMMNLIFEKS